MAIIKFGKSTIQYTVLKSKRRKTSEVQVDENGVRLCVPVSKTNLQIKNILEGKKQWIYKKQLEFKSEKKDQKRNIYKNVIPHLGKSCILKINLEQKKKSIKFINSQFTVNLTGKRFLRREVQKIYNEWLTTKATKYLEARTVKLGTKIGLKPSKIQTKNLKGRWGSASKGTITLNSNLMKCSKDTIDYIIIHELCHLKIQDHSHRYWNLVRKHYPKYEEKVKELEVLSRIVL
jgi:predicted metal-dependent hydrolase